MLILPVITQIISHLVIFKYCRLFLQMRYDVTAVVFKFFYLTRHLHANLTNVVIFSGSFQEIFEFFFPEVERSQHQVLYDIRNFMHTV